MRIFALLALLIATTLPTQAAEPCQVIHGRAHFYGGDGRVRVWHIGTHHEYEPDQSSWDRVMAWLEAGVKDADKGKYASANSMLYLYGDFLVCPVELFKKGAVQMARIKWVKHRRYVPLK
jgi:hypothetical protein